METVKQFLKYGTGGFAATVFEYLLTIFLVEILLLHPSLAYAISLIIGIILIFKFHSYITFRTDGHFPKFITIMGTYYFFLWLSTTLLIRYIPYYLAILLTIAVLGPIVFFINKFVVFQNKSI